MTPQHASFAIIGAGIAGLHAAALLERHGVRDYVLLEARGEPGGRIAPLAGPGAHGAGGDARPSRVDRFDLGPTWFWPDMQPALDHLIEELGLARFTQFEAGDMMTERSPEQRPMRTRGYVGAPAAMRLAGGMSALVDALRAPLDPARLAMGRTVRRLRCEGDHVVIDGDDRDGGRCAWRARHVLLALPPRLAAGTIAFEPALPAALHEAWQDTPTWMAPHAKYLAVYDTPFWRDAGLSGEARSGCGPMVEIHDASMPGGSAALFGFIGVPARVRRDVPDDVLRTHCRAQLVRLFGPQAATPRIDAIKDWAQDPLTATPADLDAPGHHAAAPPAGATSGAWAGRLTGIASEWSPQFPGYVAGAIEAAAIGVRPLLAG